VILDLLAQNFIIAVIYRQLMCACTHPCFLELIEESEHKSLF